MKNANSIRVILGIAAAAAVILLTLNSLKTEQLTTGDHSASTELSEETAEATALKQEPGTTASFSAELGAGSTDTSSDSPSTASNSSSNAQITAAENTPEPEAVTQPAESHDDSIAEEDPTAPRLSQRVLEVVTEVQTRQLDGQWEEALNEMNALYLAFDELNPFEQATLLNFYTNTLLQLEMYQEAISAFNRMLSLPELRPDVNARAILALGQLHNQLGEPDAAVSYYEQWLAFTAERPEREQQIPRVQQLLAQARVAAGNQR